MNRKDANHQFRDRTSGQDVQWGLLAFFLFVAVDFGVVRFGLT